MSAVTCVWSAVAVFAAGVLSAHAGARGVRHGPPAFPPKKRLVYDVQYSNASLTDFASMSRNIASSAAAEKPTTAAGGQNLKTSISGSLVVTVLRSAADEALLACSLQGGDVKIVYNETIGTPDVARVTAALAREFYATVNSGGRIVRVEFAPHIDATSRSFARTLIGALQFILPAEHAEGTMSWDAEEEDPNGRYAARYERAKSGENGNESHTSLEVFTKKKIKYLDQTGAPNRRVVVVPLTIVPVGETIVHRDSQTGCLLSVRGTEHQVISLTGRTVADSKSEWAFSLASSTIVAEAETGAMSEARENSLPALIATSLLETTRDKAAEARHWQSLLGTATWESLREDLARADSMDRQPQAQLAEKLEALCRLRPESCGEMAGILATAPYRSEAFRMVMITLARAGNPDAQAALLTAVRARGDEPAAMVMLIGVVHMLQDPTRETESALRTLAFGDGNPQVAHSAQLAFGTLAGRLSETEPERAAEIIKELSTQLQLAASYSSKARLLGALGNARTKEALNVIHQHLTGADVDIRAKALSVLVRIDPEHADELLAKFLLEDPDEAVRLTAARELSSRKATAESFRAQERALLNEQAPSVRATLLNNLWAVREDFPEGERLVKRAATEDASQEIRQMAHNLAAGSPSKR